MHLENILACNVITSGSNRSEEQGIHPSIKVMSVWFVFFRNVYGQLAF